MTAPRLRKRSVLLMIVFTLITLGFYYPIWFLRRRAALNALDSPRKIAWWPPVVMLVVMAIAFMVGFAGGLTHARDAAEVIGAGGATLLLLARLGVGILMLIQAFFVKDILEDAIQGPGTDTSTPMLSTPPQLSGLLTFFFSIFYLQYVINRDVLASSTPA